MSHRNNLKIKKQGHVLAISICDTSIEIQALLARPFKGGKTVEGKQWNNAAASFQPDAAASYDWEASMESHYQHFEHGVISCRVRTVDSAAGRTSYASFLCYADGNDGH